MPKDPVRSIYQCEALHGSYTRCTAVEGHDGPHSNGSYVWADKPTAEQKAKFAEVVIIGRASKVVGSEDQEKG